MPWYVFALVDQPPGILSGAGLSGPLATRPIPGGFVIVERRADVPPLEFATLRAHDAVLARLSRAVPAILPVRFGTLLDMDDIDEALADRDDEIAEALDVVRGRVQFTWRRATRSSGRPAPRTEATARGLATEARIAKAASMSGTEYLRRAAHRPSQSPPAPLRAVREKLGSLVIAERYQRATTRLPESLYHLVNRTDAPRYRLAAKTLASAIRGMRVTGPFPPFAFTPELL